MKVVLNGRDEPRVLFNPREPGALQRALTENTDENSFHHRPAPSSLWFKDRKKCIIETNPNGFTEHANDVSGCKQSLFGILYGSLNLNSSHRRLEFGLYDGALPAAEYHQSVTMLCRHPYAS